MLAARCSKVLVLQIFYVKLKSSTNNFFLLYLFDKGWIYLFDKGWITSTILIQEGE